MIHLPESSVQSVFRYWKLTQRDGGGRLGAGFTGRFGGLEGRRVETLQQSASGLGGLEWRGGSGGQEKVWRLPLFPDPSSVCPWGSQVGSLYSIGSWQRR